MSKAPTCLRSVVPVLLSAFLVFGCGSDGGVVPSTNDQNQGSSPDTDNNGSDGGSIDGEGQGDNNSGDDSSEGDQNSGPESESGGDENGSEDNSDENENSSNPDNNEGNSESDVEANENDEGGDDNDGEGNNEDNSSDQSNNEDNGSDQDNNEDNSSDQGDNEDNSSDQGNNEDNGSDQGNNEDNGSDQDNNEDNNSDQDNIVQSKPNIILVITDDQGLDASAQYDLSDDLPYTPVIDSLAANGITYENAWATPSCTTTRAALLTGKHGVNNGVPSTPGILAPEIGTIQQYLGQNAAEYETAVFGKWHVAGGSPDPDHPSDLGVGHYAGNLTGNITDYYDWTVTTNGVESRNDQYHTTALVDFASAWIAEQSTPWFTWIAFSAPHSPFHAPPEGFNRRGLSGTANDIDNNKREYFLAAIETLDTELGRLLDSLDSDVRDNTIVMVIGDNGTPRPVIDRSVFVGSHGKGSLFEGGIHVPLVISGAGVTRTNVREPGLVSIVDFFPTISELAGSEGGMMNDGYSLVPSFSGDNSIARELLYTEYLSDDPLGSGWTVRSATHKYIAYEDGSEAVYDLVNDPDEASSLVPVDSALQPTVDTLRDFGLSVRNASDDSSEESDGPLNITNANLSNSSPGCADHVRSYLATATDASTGSSYDATLDVTVTDTQCVFSANATPNHTFNDGADPFPNAFSTQSVEYRVPMNPSLASDATALSLQYDNAVLLNGVKVDLLAAGCFGVGNGKVGCNDDAQLWRYDPMFASNGFRVDSHNAHTQPNGEYHYHGDPIALFDRSGSVVSPVIGFAADGFPIFGSYIEADGAVRKATSSFQLRAGARPSGDGEPGGTYDGSFRDDYEYVQGSGDLDECNGMSVNGAYGYYIIMVPMGTTSPMTIPM